jgi:isopenicillin N synthase-like dioxygenase
MTPSRVKAANLDNMLMMARYSMPFFFGFNFNEKCGVLPSCTSPENPAKYEPM